MEIIDRVKELIDNYLQENDIELVDIIYRREQQGMVLRLLVDTPQGITMRQCEDLNSFLGDLLEKENAIEEHYILEVSSPGLDRPIVTDRDFERVMGKTLTVTTYEPIDNKRMLEGALIGMGEGNIVIESDGVSTAIPRIKVAKAVLKIEF